MPTNIITESNDKRDLAADRDLPIVRAADIPPEMVQGEEQSFPIDAPAASVPATAPAAPPVEAPPDAFSPQQQAEIDAAFQDARGDTLRSQAEPFVPDGQFESYANRAEIMPTVPDGEFESLDGSEPPMQMETQPDGTLLPAGIEEPDLSAMFPPQNYSELVLGGLPQYELPTGLDEWYNNMQGMQQQLAQSRWNDRVGQLMNHPYIPSTAQPTLTGYADPRFLTGLASQQARAEQQAAGFGAINPNSMPNYFENGRAPLGDPRVPRSTTPTVGAVTPGASAQAARREGNSPPSNAWRRLRQQVGSFTNLLSGIATDWFVPSDGRLDSITDIPSAALNVITGNNPLDRAVTGGLLYGMPGEEVARTAPNASRALGEFAVEIAPVQDPNNPELSLFDPLRGYFGEFGAGLPGAALYTLAAPGQIAMASIYSTVDLARYLAGGRENLPGNEPDAYGVTGFRYYQALTGQDLGFTNFRDGSGNRYLAAIPTGEGVTRNEQIGWGVLGFLGDTIGMGWVDNALGASVRLGRENLEAIRRTGSVTEGLEAARRLRVQRGISLRNDLQQTLPNFRVDEELPTPAQLAPAPAPPVQAMPDGTLAMPPASVLPQQIPDITPDMLGLPRFRRSNEELTRLGQNLAYPDGRPVIPPDVGVITNSQRAQLETIYGDAFARYGDELPFLPRPDPDSQALARILDPASHTEQSRVLQEEVMNAAAGRPFDSGRTQDALDSLFRQRDELTSPEVVRHWQENSAPDFLRGADIDTTQTYVLNQDELLDAARATRTIEETMTALHRNVFEHANELTKRHAPYIRGNVMDELNARATYGDAEAQSLLDIDLAPRPRDLDASYRPPNPTPLASQLRQRQWFHGSKVDVEQLRDLRPDLGSGSNELGSGLYLTPRRELGALYAKTGRNPSVPIVGSRRVSTTGNLYTTDISVVNTLDAGAVPTDSIKRAFRDAIRDTFGADPQLFKEYSRLTRNQPVDRWWLALREAHSNVRQIPMPEVDYRTFSTSVANRLRNRGYDSIWQPTRETLVVLDQPRRGLPVRTLNVERGIGDGTSLEAGMAQHYADNLLNAYYRNRTTEAWEMQSRLTLESRMMEEVTASYNDSVARGADAVEEFLESERAVREVTRETQERALRNMEQGADLEAEQTARQFIEDIDTDSPCL